MRAGGSPCGAGGGTCGGQVLTGGGLTGIAGLSVVSGGGDGCGVVGRGVGGTCG